MGFLDKLGEVIGDAREGAVDATTQFRYGVSPAEKARIMYSRELPGAPSYMEDPEAAERYASAYLGAKKWGQIPAELMNAIALTDLVSPLKRSVTRKQWGHLGAEAGARMR